MVEKRQPIPVAEAVHRVMDYAFQAKKEHVPLTQAHGRFLAQAIRADHDVPAFDRSPYDAMPFVPSIVRKPPHSIQSVFKSLEKLGQAMFLKR